MYGLHHMVYMLDIYTCIYVYIYIYIHHRKRYILWILLEKLLNFRRKSMTSPRSLASREGLEPSGSSLGEKRPNGRFIGCSIYLLVLSREWGSDL